MTAPAAVPRSLAEIDAALADLDARLLPFGSFEDAPEELLDELAMLCAECDHALNREQPETAPADGRSVTCRG